MGNKQSNYEDGDNLEARKNTSSVCGKFWFIYLEINNMGILGRIRGLYSTDFSTNGMEQYGIITTGMV